MEIAVTEKLEGVGVVLIDETGNYLFWYQWFYQLEERLILLQVLLLWKFGQLCVVGLWIGLQNQKGDVIAEHIQFSDWEVEFKGLRQFLVASRYGFFKDSVAPAGLRIVFLVVVVDSHVRVEIGLDISDFRIVDVILIDLFGDNVESNVIFLLEHDLHLV